MKKNLSKIKKNILKYTKYKGYSKRKIYLDTGIANGVLDKETGLSENNIMLFIFTYPEVNPAWLLTGKGEMILNPVFSEGIITKEKIVTIVEFLIQHEEELMKDPIFQNYIEKLIYKFLQTEKFNSLK